MAAVSTRSVGADVRVSETRRGRPLASLHDGTRKADQAVVLPDLVRRLEGGAFGLWLADHPSQDPFGTAQAVLALTWFDPEAKPDPELTNLVPDPDDPPAAGQEAVR